MNDILYEKLVYLSKVGKIVSIYSNEDSEQFCVGYILAVNYDYILIQHLSPNGKYDGYVFQKISNIYRVGYDEPYTEKIRKLYDLEHHKHEDMDVDSTNILVQFLKRAAERKWVVAIELNESGLYDVQEFVLESNEKNITIQKIADNGKYDGITCFDSCCITSGEGDTEDGQSLKLLAQLCHSKE